MDHDLGSLLAGDPRTLELLDEAGEAARADLASRHLAGALLHLRRWEEAFELLDVALEARGPLFGGGGVTVFSHADTDEEEALDEARAVALWASREVPEWVRVLGSLSEVFAGDEQGPELLRRYEEGLALLLAEKKPLDDLEVVIRQLRQRSHRRAAALAARRGVEAFSEDSWIQSVCANIARELGDLETAYQCSRAAAELLPADSPSLARAWEAVGEDAARLGQSEEADAAFAKARALTDDDGPRLRQRLAQVRSYRERDPEQAIERGLALLEEVKSTPEQLSESSIGFGLIDLLLDLLLAKQDRRALEVQRALVEAKRSRWGECPALWLELHNLGTVHATLGELAEARGLIEDALAQLRAALGDRDANVRLAERSLARVEEQERERQGGAS